MDAMNTGTASDHRDMEENNAGGGPAAGHRRDAHESAWNLLVLARQLMDQGKPSLALQIVSSPPLYINHFLFFLEVEKNDFFFL